MLARVVRRLMLGGGTKPIGSRRRRLLNHDTHSSAANSTSSRLRHSPFLWITSALYRPLVVSPKALSYESPTPPTDSSIPASFNRSLGGEGAANQASSPWSRRQGSTFHIGRNPTGDVFHLIFNLIK